MKKDLVYLLWKNKEHNHSYKVAELYKYDNKYYFKYILENVKDAIEDGFTLLVAFPNVNAIYESPNLFAVFASRLPDERRPEIKNILETYNLNNYDEFELLKKSGAKLPTDNYEFIE